MPRRQGGRRMAGAPSQGGFQEVPLPVGGWNTASRLQALPPVFSPRLDNWYAEDGRLVQRAGRTSHVTELIGEVETLFAFEAGSNKRLFAAYSGRIADVTTYPRTVIFNGAGSNRWDATMFAALGSQYLVGCNGVDRPVKYDGSTYSFMDIDDGAPKASFKGVIAHVSRLWFFEGMSLWYMPTGSIGGAATEFDLGGQLGSGKIACIGTWSFNDAGSGLDDALVAVTTTGKVIAYRGSDPASATTWEKIGIYEIPVPLGGTRCMTKVGGELYILTTQGPLSMGEIYSGNRRPLAIEPEFRRQAALYPNAADWNIKWHKGKNRLICNIPNVYLKPIQYVLSLDSGAWCRTLSRRIKSMHEFDGKFYIGNENGTVFLDDVGASDDGDPIESDCMFSPNLFGYAGTKDWKRARVDFKSGSSIRPSIQMVSDYQTIAATAAEESETLPLGAVWDVDNWDEGIWGGVPTAQKVTVTLEGSGSVGSLRVGVRGSLESAEMLSAWATFKRGRLL